MWREARVEHQLHRGAARRARGARGGVAQQRLHLDAREDAARAAGEADVREGAAASLRTLDVHAARAPRRGRPASAADARGARDAARLLVDDVERGERGGRRVRRQRRREAVARAREALVRADPVGAGAEAADGGEGVLHRADDDVDRRRRVAVVLGDAAARRAEGADRERLVDDQVAAVLVAQPEEVGQVAEAAAVGVEALDEEEAARVLRGGQLLGLVACCASIASSAATSLCGKAWPRRARACTPSRW